MTHHSKDLPRKPVVLTDGYRPTGNQPDKMTLPRGGSYVNLPHYATHSSGAWKHPPRKQRPARMLGFVLSGAIGFWSAVGVLVLAVRVFG